MSYVLAILTLIGCWIYSVPAFALGPLVVYSKEDASYDDILYYRSFSSSWGSEGTAVDTNVSGALTNHVAVTRPDGREQAVVAWATGSTNVHVTIYNGTNWDNGSGSPYADAKVITGVSSVYAAAYEQNSGQLLIAVGSGAQMKYYLWDGSSWVIDGSTQTFTNLTQTVQLIRMASKPGAGEIALMATDGTNCVGLIWDGSANAWGTEQKLNTDSVSLHYAAAVTYMQTGTYGGRALFVWDETYTEELMDYHRLKSRSGRGRSGKTSIELYGSKTPVGLPDRAGGRPRQRRYPDRLSVQQRRRYGPWPTPAPMTFPSRRSPPGTATSITTAPSMRSSSRLPDTAGTS